MKNNKGFSMVELIIVIAIMAVLAGALAPTLIKYINQSRKSADINNATEIAKAAQMALAEAEIADYVFSQTMPYSIPTNNLDTTDLFENFIAQQISTNIMCKYTKYGANTFQITVYQNSDSTSYFIEVSAIGNGVPDTPGAKGSGMMLYPSLDPSYQEE